MLHVHNLSKSFGVHTVLSSVDLIVNRGERVGLVGPNGSGKSTLIRCIVGEDRPDSGRVDLASGTNVGYLAQSLQRLASKTVGTAIRDARAGWLDAESAVQAAAEEMANDPTEAAINAYERALAEFEALGGFEHEHRAEAILDGLGLGCIDAESAVSTLSGGQKTRLGLAMLLLNEPDLLLLDEPTNHLDIEALVWLEGFVSSFQGAVLLVSHDREFLDRTVERIVFLDSQTGQLCSYVGNYTAFAEARAAEREQHEEDWTRQQEYMGRVTGDIARLKGQALAIERSTTPRQPGVRKYARRKAKVAKSRERKLERYMQSEDRVEKPALSWGLNLDFGTPPPAGQDVLRLQDVTFGYQPDRPLLSDVSFDLRHGARVALVGPNGAGKTTLLKLMGGLLSPASGLVRIGANVRTGFLAQEQETLDPACTVLETARRERPMTETDARKFLHFFLFGGERVFRSVGACSPGERTRLQLALLVLRGCNVLLLDEPLNHLDIDGRKHFEAALGAFDGTIIAVAHDRAFLRDFATQVIEVRNAGVRSFVGGYDNYLRETDKLL